MSKRLFFALPINKPQQQCLVRLADNQAVEGRRVPAPNLHVTLAFLGKVDDQQQARLVAFAATLKVAPFELVFDNWVYWRRAQVLVLGAHETPPTLSALVAKLSRRARKLGLVLDDRQYHAHITLFRKARKPLKQTIALDVTERFILAPTSFVLYESSQIPGGVEYVSLGEWPIG